jgi:hypothetical protein
VGGVRGAANVCHRSEKRDLVQISATTGAYPEVALPMLQCSERKASAVAFDLRNPLVEKLLASSSLLVEHRNSI